MVGEKLFRDIMVRMIEETSDGFLILNPGREVIFLNEVFLRMMGQRSIDFFAREKEFIRNLRLGDSPVGTKVERIPDGEGSLHPFNIEIFSFEGERGVYLLLRFNPLYRGAQEKYQTRGNIESLFNHLGDPVFTCDLKGKIISANNAFFKLLGVPAEQSDLSIGPYYVNQAELEDKIMRLLKEDSIYNLDTHLYTEFREIRRVLDSSWVIRNEKGIVTGYSSHLRDVTYLRNLEARLQISERNYLMLMDSILSPLILVDPLGRILNFNYAAEQFYGYRWEEVVGKYFDDITRPEGDRPTLRDILRLVDENDGRHIETDVPRKCRDGTIKFAYSSYSALTDSQKRIIAYSIMEKDLTERVRLERKLKDSFSQLKQTQSAAILGFARLTEYRDKSTGKHLERIREYTRILATALRELPQYRDYITDLYIEDLCLSSVLHDVGKVGIEDSILFKPGKLDAGEFNRIKDHSRLGGDALSQVDQAIVRQSFLTLGKQIAYYHHERWDGSGYPRGLKGNDIPLSARIVALADVYDALTSSRIYKEALTHDQAVALILSERGTHFDPEIVDVFAANHEVFRRINTFISLQDSPSSIDELMTRPDNRKKRTGLKNSRTSPPAKEPTAMEGTG